MTSVDIEADMFWNIPLSSVPVFGFLLRVHLSRPVSSHVLSQKGYVSRYGAFCARLTIIRRNFDREKPETPKDIQSRFTVHIKITSIVYQCKKITYERSLCERFPAKKNFISKRNFVIFQKYHKTIQKKIETINVANTIQLIITKL